MYRVRELLEYWGMHYNSARRDVVRGARRYSPPTVRVERRPGGPRPTLIDVFARHPDWAARAAEPRARAVLRLRWPR